MKKIILFFLVVPLLGLTQSYQKVMRVLFLGNSYTYFNNLPGIVAGIAKANGDSLLFDANTPGGYTFSNHAIDATTIGKISLGTWDYVILQAQSQEPSFSPAQVAQQTLPYSVKLDSIIKKHNPCAITAFYETWGRKNGDVSNCAFYPPICTYIGMQNRLKQSYKLFADTAKGIFVPVGEAFRSSISFSPALELYQSDESHPSLEGSYLAAALFYESLFQRSVLSNTYNPGISGNNLTFLQQRAHQVMRDSLAEWNFGKYAAWAEFEVDLQNNPGFTFTGKSPNLSNTWYFGDGTTSVVANPSHTFASTGTYTVWHVVKEACKTDSVYQIIQAINTVGLTNTKINHVITVYPNPCSHFLHFRNAQEYSDFEIRDLCGASVASGLLEATLDLSALKPGMYFIKVFSKESAAFINFIKE